MNNFNLCSKCNGKIFTLLIDSENNRLLTQCEQCGYERIFIRIKELNISRTISKEIRYIVLNRQYWRCNQCGEKLKYNSEVDWSNAQVAHIDHIFPYSKRKEYPNGEDNINEPENLQALCPDCNNKKRDKTTQ